MLYYTGTVILHMAPRTFWRCTPVRLNALSAVHAEVNNPHKVRTAKTVEEAGFEI